MRIRCFDSFIGSRYNQRGAKSGFKEWCFVVDYTMGTVERAGDDHTSEVESGEEEEIVGGGELAQHLMKR